MYILALMDAKTLDELVGKLSALVPSGLSEARADIENNFRAVLNGWFDRMDLVTREEFEVQKAVLARTRAKLDALEAKLAEDES